MSLANARCFRHCEVFSDGATIGSSIAIHRSCRCGFSHFTSPIIMEEQQFKSSVHFHFLYSSAARKSHFLELSSRRQAPSSTARSKNSQVPHKPGSKCRKRGRCYKPKEQKLIVNKKRAQNIGVGVRTNDNGKGKLR